MLVIYMGFFLANIAEVLMYNELPLVSRGPPRKSTSTPSDPATNVSIH